MSFVQPVPLSLSASQSGRARLKQMQAFLGRRHAIRLTRQQLPRISPSCLDQDLVVAQRARHLEQLPSDLNHRDCSWKPSGTYRFCPSAALRAKVILNHHALRPSYLGVTQLSALYAEIVFATASQIGRKVVQWFTAPPRLSCQQTASGLRHPPRLDRRLRARCGYAPTGRAASLGLRCTALAPDLRQSSTLRSKR